MTSTMQSPMDRTARRASRAFALRHPDPVRIGVERRVFAKESGT